MPEDPDSDLPEEARRILASRRRELEREFDLKRADLKAQHARRIGVLEQEKKEWLEHKRQQAKELADRTEKVRRNTDNQQQRIDLGAAERKELAARRSQVRALERAERETGRRAARAEGELAAASARLASDRRRTLLAMACLTMGGVGWLLFGSRAGPGILLVAVPAAFGFLATTLRKPRDSDRER